jgi:hypothetical protein
MPIAPLPPCRTPTCPGRGPGYCRACQQRLGLTSARPTARQRGYSQGWDRIARAFLQQHAVCGELADGTFDVINSECARTGRRTAATCVNHRVSPRHGGSWTDESNFVASCRSCNLAHAHRTGLMVPDDEDVSLTWG